MFNQPYIGMVTIFAGNYAPQNWAFCHGQQLEISMYTALYSIIGLTYGGDGASTFALPDFRGRVAIHAGQGTGLEMYYTGQTGGNENFTLTVNQMPAHSHAVAKFSATSPLPCSTAQGTLDSPTGNVPAVVNAAAASYSTAATEGTSLGAMVNTGQTQPSTGKSTPVPVLSPYLAMNYIICMDGYYPSHLQIK